MKRPQERFLISCTVGALLAAVAAAAAVPAAAADTKTLGVFNDWSAHQFAEKSGQVCYLYSVPKKSAGDYTRRGDTFVQVTHRPGEKTQNVVSVTAGYPYRKGSEVTVNIDGKKFALFTEGDTAWAADAAADASLVDAMRAGRTMIVLGTSSRGTLTTDTYSLSGFTAAHKAINKACGVK